MLLTFRDRALPSALCLHMLRPETRVLGVLTRAGHERTLGWLGS
jgi:hypothetical protein